jgi:glycosyltransferase involved in cell wall biosynthesis
MPSDALRSAYELCLVCYPFYPCKDSGRGVDRYCFELIENLRAQAQHVRLKVMEQGSSIGALHAGKKLARLLVDLVSVRSEVYHAVSPPAGATALLFGKRRVVVTVHDLLPFQVKGYNPSLKLAYARWCNDVCVKRADAIIVPFRVTKDELVRAHGAQASKIHVVNYGLDHGTYHVRPGVPRHANKVLYVGELSRAKGVDVLIRAFEALKRRVPGAELWIGGKGKDRELLEAMASSLGLRDVKFMGFVPEDELADLYASASVMVFPSRYGFGLSTLEAMACGTPVIATETLDAPEFLEGAGLMVKPEDVTALAQSIEGVLTDPALRADLSARGIERAARYSWASTAAQTRAVCDTLAR